MNLVNRFFSNNKVDCPRCLGKGEVNWDDIRRLKKELKWLPGPCAYCLGKAKVYSDFQSKIDIDCTYLTTDLSTAERKKLIANDEGARQRALYHDIKTDCFISEIKYLHFSCKVNSAKIAGFYLLNQNSSTTDSNENNELIEYIEKVISLKNEQQ